MDSTSRQVMTMKYENQLELGGPVDLLEEVDLLHQTSLSGPIIDEPPPPPLFSKSSSLDDMEVLQGESSHSIMPSLDEPTPPALLSTSSSVIAQQSGPILGIENSVHKSKSIERKFSSKINDLGISCIFSNNGLIIIRYTSRILPDH